MKIIGQLCEESFSTSAYFRIPLHLCVKRVVDHFVGAEPLCGVHPGDLEDVVLSPVDVNVLSFNVFADPVVAQPLNHYQRFVITETPFLDEK